MCSSVLSKEPSADKYRIMLVVGSHMTEILLMVSRKPLDFTHLFANSMTATSLAFMVGSMTTALRFHPFVTKLQSIHLVSVVAMGEGIEKQI